MRRISLTEYQTTRSVLLSHEERDNLAAIIPGLDVNPTPGVSGRYDLTPGSWIGVVDLPDLTVEIRPKLPVDSVAFMLSYALEGGRWRSIEGSLASQSDLVEAMVPIFAEAVRRALRRGVLQGYRSKEDALLTVRGRIRFDDQIRDRFGIVPPVEVRFDEFTVDTTPNRLIRAALHRLSHLRIRAPESRGTLRALDARLAQVALVEFDRRALPEISFNRLNERYRPAVELAKLIIENTSLQIRSGSRRASAFLFDMNKVFEDFVVIALREALGLSASSFPQNCRGRRLVLDEAERIKLRPDLSWWWRDECLFVGDVKYKRLELPGFKHSDVYQMLAYCTATDLPGGLLVYAAGEPGPTAHDIVHAGKRIEVVHLNLAGAPEQVLDEVEDVARRIRQWRDFARTAA